MADFDVNVTGTIADGAVTNAKLAQMAEQTIKGRAVGAGTGAPQDLTPNQASTILDEATDPFVRTSALGGAALRTGAAIAFDSPAVYNSPTSPSSATVTLDLTGAVAGTEVVAYFNHSAEPTWPSGITAYGNWYASNVNVVRFVYRDSSNISAVIQNDAPAASGGAWTTVKKTSTTTRTSTSTLAPDPDLKVTMLANTTYHIRGVIYGSTNATPDFKYRFTGPASPTSVRIDRIHRMITGTPPSNGMSAAYDSSDLVFNATWNQAFMFEFWIQIVNGANAGDFNFEWAQNTSDVANTNVTSSFIDYMVG